ncbi:MAG: hypothetical protein U9R47_05455 [Actinomycetota bacterium]|nr:hypothetical protein [Actinomycetota bacterium]
MFVVGFAIAVLTSMYVGALVGLALISLAKPVSDMSSVAHVANRVPRERRRYA